MPGRKFGTENRYGFNGKERDKDLHSLTAYDYGFRIYNPAIGKFLSVDPLTQSYPYYTPYQFAGNSTIQNTDLDGAEEEARNYVSWSLMQAQAQQFARECKAKKAAEVAANPPKPIIPQVNSEAPPQAIRQARMTAMIKNTVLPPKTFQTPPQASVSATNTSPWALDRSKEFSDEAKRNENINNAVMSPEGASFFGGMYATTVGAYETGKGIVNNGVGLYEGIRDGDPGKILSNGFQLALVAAPFIPIKGVGAMSTLPTRLARVIPEEFASGATTLGKAGDIEAFVVDAAALKGLTTSEQVAQKLTLLNKDWSLIKGPFRVIEFDTPTVGLAQPFNRLNTGFVNGGKTLGGATEYVIPNTQIKNLNNVTQITIK